MIYTGERSERPEWISLSEEFFLDQECFVDIRVKMLYDGKKGDIINQYVTFTKIYNEQVKKYGRTGKAVLETIHICKDSNVLKEYLKNREKEVVDIMMTLFDQEYAVERYGDEKKAEGIAEGLAEGEMKKAKETTYRLADRKMPLEAISDIVEVSVEVVKKWLAERPVR